MPLHLQGGTHLGPVAGCVRGGRAAGPLRLPGWGGTIQGYTRVDTHQGENLGRQATKFWRRMGFHPVPGAPLLGIPIPAAPLAPPLVLTQIWPGCDAWDSSNYSDTCLLERCTTLEAEP
jgi:hypothetical protein